MENLFSILNRWSPIINVATTISIAYFTFVLLRINKRQHFIDYEQKLRIYKCNPTFAVSYENEKDYYEGKGLIETHIACVLVNSSILPLVINKIDLMLVNKAGKKYHFSDAFIHDIAKTDHIYGEPEIVKESVSSIFIKTIPWVIPGKGFAIFSRKYDGIPMEYQSSKIHLDFIYYNESQKKDLTERVVDILSTLPDLPIYKSGGKN